MTSAMKAREKERVGALRMVLSELQKAAKEGNDDEVAVLRRERKRRLEAAEQFREGGRPELADREQSEATLIETYLPAELDDAELDAIIRDAVAETGATEPKDMGQGDEGRDGQSGRPRRRQARVGARARGAELVSGAPASTLPFRPSSAASARACGPLGIRPRLIGRCDRTYEGGHSA